MIFRRLPGVLLLLSLAAVPAGAQQSEERVFPVSLNVEGEYRQTSMLLRLPWKTYGRPVSVLANERLDDDERAFVRFAEAIRANDVTTVQSLFELPSPGAGAAATAGMAVPPLTPDQLVQSYRQAFNGFLDVKLEGRVPVDGATLFLWRGTTSRGAILRGFVVRAADGQRRVAEVTMTRPIEVFLVNTLGHVDATVLSGTGQRVSPDARTYSWPLTGTGVRLEFNGRRLNENVAVASAKAEAKAILAPLRARAAALSGKKLEQLYALHTPRSGTKLKEWYASMTPEAFDSYVLSQSGPRFVKFVIDAAPLAIVFSADTESNTWPVGGLQYDYLLRDASGYRIANVHYQSFFDDLLKASPGLRQLIRNERGRVPQVR
jgi:hypothetical protein